MSRQKVYNSEFVVYDFEVCSTNKCLNGLTFHSARIYIVLRDYDIRTSNILFSNAIRNYILHTLHMYRCTLLSCCCCECVCCDVSYMVCARKYITQGEVVVIVMVTTKG